MTNTNNMRYLTLQKYWRTVVTKETTVGYEQLQIQIEAHKRLLNIFQPGNFYFLLFDIYKAEIISVSNEVVNLLGYQPDTITMKQFLENIHEEDKMYFLDFENWIASFFISLDLKDYKNYKVQYDLRMKTARNVYVRILIQYVLVNYDDHNIYNSFHVHTDITHIKPVGRPCFSIIGLDGKPSYYNIQSANFTQSSQLFTRREKEILKGIVEGKTSKELGDELCISLHTLHTHRKNILRKANTKTPIDLVRKAICEGWV